MQRLWPLLAFLLLGCATLGGRKWQVYDAGAFTFELPADFKQTSARGIDSHVEDFKGQGMIVGFDYGQWSNNFDEWPSSEFESVIADGRAARVGTVAHSFGHPFPYTTQIAFRDVHPPIATVWRTHLSISANVGRLKIASAQNEFLSP